MASRTHPLLQVSNLQTSFFTDKGEIKAVDDVSFALHGGQTLALVGEALPNEIKCQHHNKDRHAWDKKEPRRVKNESFAIG